MLTEYEFVRDHGRVMDELSYLWRGYEEGCRIDDRPEATTAGFITTMVVEHLDYNEDTGESLTFQEWIDMTVCDWKNIGHY